MKKIKIYKISGKGDELLLETDIKAEARKVLLDAQECGCSFAVNLPTDVDSELVKEIDEIFKRGVGTVHILYPMAGGNG